jgi:catechol 2,3-dioxygenase-like lactoylglutathione lyase family enzyme
MSKNVVPVAGLNHISLMTKRLEAAIAFYTDVLGFKPQQRPDFDFRGAWLYRDGLMIHLIENAQAHDPQEKIDGRYTHFALHSDDIEAVAALLSEHGVRYRRSALPGWGSPQIFFHDPDGNVIEIGTYRPLPRE